MLRKNIMQIRLFERDHNNNIPKNEMHIIVMMATIATIDAGKKSDNNRLRKRS